MATTTTTTNETRAAKRAAIVQRHALDQLTYRAAAREGAKRLEQAIIETTLSNIGSSASRLARIPSRRATLVAKLIAPYSGVDQVEKETQMKTQTQKSTAKSSKPSVATAEKAQAPKGETKKAPKGETKKAPKGETKKAPKGETERTPRHVISDDSKFSFVASEHPFREGTKGEQAFKLAKVGRTVGEWREALAKTDKPDFGYLHGLLRRGLVKINEKV